MIATPTIEKYSCERIPLAIYSSENAASIHVAEEIANLIRKRQKSGEYAILGLATGATPLKVYRELVRMHRDEGLSFQNVITFNLDEYYPITKKSLLSYYHFMHVHLFDHVDILKENIHIPDGEVRIEDVKSFCDGYEELIDAHGGIDIQLLGIGRTGHIGFNEPPSFRDSLTRLVKLDPITIADATREFLSEDAVPRRAITMGVQSIFKSKKIFLMAWGEKKSKIIGQLVEGIVREALPASFLQNHPDALVLLDRGAALELTRNKSPWLVSLCDWDDVLAKKAIIWLSQKLNKPILKLTEEDYKHHDLGDLIVYYGDVHDLNVKIFRELQKTITGWPGGKPNESDENRPERSVPAVKTAIIFSPHPDDDVISMGGTFLRMVKQGHQVHVAYQTSGSIAVHDDDALRYTEFIADFMLETQGISMKNVQSEVREFLATKEEGQPDIPIVKSIKGLIRKEEARAGARFCGVPDKHIHFLNLPFYEASGIEKVPHSSADIDLVKKLLIETRPHQVFAAGDLRDPHGTHKICLDVILDALRALKEEGEEWVSDCYLWLYRGAWQEWPVHEIDMAVPFSPSDLVEKRKAIFKHQSQKDYAVFPGSDKREFWQRAEERNRATAKIYDSLGLTEYEAMEAFVRYRFS